MSYYKEASKFFDKCHSGESTFIPLVRSPHSDILSKLGACIPIGKSMYMMLGGQSGSGKTAIVDSEFILKAYFWWKRNRDTTNIKPYWFYRSMERPTKFKIGKWISYLFYVEHGIRMDVPTLFGFPNKKRELTDEERKLFKSYESWFEKEFENYITIIPGSENPTGIRNAFLKFYRTRGKDYRANDKEITLNGKVIKRFTGNTKDEKDNRLYEVINGHKVLQYEHFYVPDDENEIVMHITDHIQALKSEQGFNDKQLLDKHSEYCRVFRDIYGSFIINLSQFNRGSEDSTRKYKGELDVLESDFKGSSNMYQDADIVLGMINPYKSGEVNQYRGYKVGSLVNEGYNRLRLMKLLKNSYGLDDARFGYGFLGECGLMMELPTGREMKTEHYKAIQECRFLDL